MAAPDTIVLIHGFWVTPRSWEDWVSYYEAKGFKVIAPAYPGLEVEVESLNADPTPIAELTVPKIVDHLESVVSALDTRRSSWAIGRRRVHADPARQGLRRLGRRAELRADRGRQGRPALAAALDVPDPQEPGEPPRAAGFTFEQFNYAFTNGVTEEESRGRCTSATRSPPTAGSCSRACSPTSSPATRTRGSTTTTTTARRCCSSPARPTTSCRRASSSRTPSTTSPTDVTEITEFAGPHFMPALAGWEKIADHALEWALANARPRPRRPE